MRTITFILLTCLCLRSVAGFGQKAMDLHLPSPEIGKPLPDFMLTVKDGSYERQMTPKDFRGKWLFLDFWYPGCASAIKSFPKISKLQQKFADHVQFVLVGLNYQRFNGIERLYDKLRVKQNLSIPFSYDTILSTRWNIKAMPRIIVVDPEGIVRSITNGQDMTNESLSAMLKENRPSFFRTGIERRRFRPADVTGDKLIYQATLSAWNGEKISVPDIDYLVGYNKSKNLPTLVFSMVPLVKLYNLAYLGAGHWSPIDSLYEAAYPKPLVEAGQRELFQYSLEQLSGLYNFSLTLGPDRMDRTTVMTAMQRALYSIFGYSVSVQRRKVPVWKMVARDGAHQKLQTTGDKPFFSDTSGSGGAAGFTMINQHPKFMIHLIRRYMDDEIPLIDATGLTGNIDITLDCLLTDQDDLRRALQQYGLDIIMEEHEMTVIVITETASQGGGR